ncbi:hypothetical protein VNI00_000479 [Paramarasmius palmivorus]|uniref:Uncharacterized protein n=1 Tax=Paramarasmius palmivorus TaxID=297713 RepID=A0AAW0E9F1_9AGAR
MNFSGAHSFKIDGNSTLNAIQRDQYNISAHTVNIQVGDVGRAVKRRRMREADVDQVGQYREILLGDIYEVQRIHAEVIWDREKTRQTREDFTQRTIYHARLYRDDRAFTAMTYRGEDAAKAWKRDFMRYSQTSDSTLRFQLFGVNRTKVPTLIFYDDWTPIAHFCHNKSIFWMSLYFTLLAEYMQCPRSEIWLNSQKGYLSRGPSGPSLRAPLFLASTLSVNTHNELPLTVEMLKIDTCVQYLSATRAQDLDHTVLLHGFYYKRLTCINDMFGIESQCSQTCTSSHRASEEWAKNDDGLWRNIRPCHVDEQVVNILDNFCFGTVYSGTQRREIARQVGGPQASWKLAIECGAFSDPKVMEDGMTRFSFDAIRLKGNRLPWFRPFLHQRAWLSQAHYVFHVQGKAGEVEDYILPTFEVELAVELHEDSEIHVTANFPGFTTINSVIYLFIRPPPTRVSDVEYWREHQVSFWSFDESGATELPKRMHEHLKLPSVVLKHQPHVRLWSWPKDVYDAIHTWQVARGFDPTTPGFARALGYPVLEPVMRKVEGMAPPYVQVTQRRLSEFPDVEGLNPSLSWWQATPDICAFAII